MISRSFNHIPRGRGRNVCAAKIQLIDDLITEANHTATICSGGSAMIGPARRASEIYSPIRYRSPKIRYSALISFCIYRETRSSCLFANLRGANSTF